jgi:hypothetical protein
MIDQFSHRLQAEHRIAFHADVAFFEIANLSKRVLFPFHRLVSHIYRVEDSLDRGPVLSRII